MTMTSGACGKRGCHRTMMVGRLLAVVILSSATAAACNIPVFRFALERWRADACELIVFSGGDLTADDEALIGQLEKSSVRNGGNSNLNVIRCDPEKTGEQQLRDLWLSMSGRTGLGLPAVVIRSQKGTGTTINHWHGSLKELRALSILNSPVRSELTKRLQSGDAVVWLVLKSASAAKNADIVKRLQAQCQNLSRRIELPEGIGLPGSELYSEVPLLLQFTVLEVEHQDPAEDYLIRQLAGFQPEAVSSGEPLVIPVFGRGRALEVIPASTLNDDLIAELTQFLCGACSCQVKEQNPGFDLLLSTNWELALFGEDGTIPPVEAAEGNGDRRTPELIPIPPGRNRK